MHKTILYIIIVVLLIAVGGEYYYFHNQHTASSQAMMAPSANHQMMMKGGKGMPPGMSMSAVTPPPLSDQQTQQITDGTDKSSTKKTFNITGGNYYFVPNKITVNKGDQVTLVMTNAGGFHDFVIDQLGVKIPVIKTGQAATATFIASNTGSFVYYCNVSGHKAKGMWGTLVVQ
jgi:plastocyanin